ncbi:DUF169 domain-containing protein [bacterium]|nr:DUF169 domain-containing protein [bacterium]
MSEVLENLDAALNLNVKPSTFPVAVKLARESEEIIGRFKRPSRDLHHPVAACQGVNITRTFGWTLVFGRDDHACPLASVAAGHLEPDEFLGGAVADAYQDDPEVVGRMEVGYPRHPMDELDQIWLSTLSRCEFEPDLIIVYGTPAQILVLIHAANYGYGEGVTSSSTGRFGCADWIAGVVQSDECEYAIPCSGEKMFAGTQDHEMSFIIPRSRFQSITEGLGIMRKKGTYRYPVLNMNFLEAPRLPEKYVELGKNK